MKKFLVPCSLPIALLLCVLFFSCSDGGFKEPKPDDLGGFDINSAKETIECIVGEAENKSCYEISRSACDIMKGREKDSSETCINFEIDCEWTPKTVQYGGQSTLSFSYKLKGAEEGTSCSYEISYGSKSPLAKGSESATLDSTYTISSPTFSGLKYDKNDSIVAEATVTCGEIKRPKKCTALKVDSVSGPKWEGELSFKEFGYTDKGIGYFFIGDTAKVNSTIKITNNEEAKCNEIEIEITGSPAKLGTPITATASVTCDHTGKIPLGSISADVKPDPVIEDCELIGKWDAMMFKKDTLFMKVPIEHNYGRCKVQNDTLPLSSYSGQLNNITAKVECSTKTYTKTYDRKCDEKIFVADKFAEIKECHNPRVPIGPGITVVEITCLDGDTPAKTFGCDCLSPGEDWSEDKNWSEASIFTLNGDKAQGGGCWATAPIPSDIANKESKRVLIEYNKEIGCVAY